MMSNQENTSRSKPFFDWGLLLLMYNMMLLGVLFISVATYNPSVSVDLPLINKIMSSESGRWQAIFTIASPVAVWFIVSIPYERIKPFVRLFYYIIMFLLVLVIGTSSIRNVSAWFRLTLGRMFQPSEFAKLAMILMLARSISSDEKPMSNFKSAVKLIGTFLLPALLTLFQGEAGTVIVMAVIFYVMIYFGGADWKWLLGLAIMAAIAIGLIFGYGIISGSDDYRLLRILSFIDPTKYAQSAGLQILNSQEAIGSGGLNGIGFFITGSHSQLNFVPEDWTDFVFATIGEAVGFVGCVAIILLYFLIVLRMLYLARYTADEFGRLIIIGVTAMMFFHVFQNIAMTIGIMPITGIPLPFLSYGGSNLLTNVAGVSLVLNVTKNRSVAVSSTSINVSLLNPVSGKRRKRKKKVYVNTSEEV
ncbi:MAG TPA: rod shape-determining protein RodA [Christensenellaceae bacterium]|nr:rod shape-determining protein RodA [Christensenellaceae bacterium]